MYHSSIATIVTLVFLTTYSYYRILWWDLLRIYKQSINTTKPLDSICGIIISSTVKVYSCKTHQLYNYYILNPQYHKTSCFIIIVISWQCFAYNNTKSRWNRRILGCSFSSWHQYLEHKLIDIRHKRELNLKQFKILPMQFLRKNGTFSK